MKDRLCEECGERLSRRGYVRRTKVGRYEVDDGSRRAWMCIRGHGDLTLDQMAGYEQRASVAVLTQACSIRGAEFRFVRKAFGLSRDSLSSVFQTTLEVIKSWDESVEDLPSTLRVALLVLGDERTVRRLREGGDTEPAKVLKVPSDDEDVDCADEPNETGEPDGEETGGEPTLAGELELARESLRALVLKQHHHTRYLESDWDKHVDHQLRCLGVAVSRTFNVLSVLVGQSENRGSESVYKKAAEKAVEDIGRLAVYLRKAFQ